MKKEIESKIRSAMTLVTDVVVMVAMAAVESFYVQQAPATPVEEVGVAQDLPLDYNPPKKKRGKQKRKSSKRNTTKKGGAYMARVTKYKDTNPVAKILFEHTITPDVIAKKVGMSQSSISGLYRKTKFNACLNTWIELHKHYPEIIEDFIHLLPPAKRHLVLKDITINELSEKIDVTSTRISAALTNGRASEKLAAKICKIFPGMILETYKGRK